MIRMITMMNNNDDNDADDGILVHLGNVMLMIC